MLSFSDRKTGRVLIGISVVCLLLCHGAFGALHLISGPLTLPVSAAEHAASHSGGEDPDEIRNGGYPAQHHTDSGYFAVLLGLLAGVALLLLGHVRRWSPTSRADPPLLSYRCSVSDPLPAEG